MDSRAERGGAEGAPRPLRVVQRARLELGRVALGSHHRPLTAPYLGYSACSDGQHSPRQATSLDSQLLALPAPAHSHTPSLPLSLPPPRPSPAMASEAPSQSANSIVGDFDSILILDFGPSSAPFFPPTSRSLR